LVDLLLFTDEANKEDVEQENRQAEGFDDFGDAHVLLEVPQVFVASNEKCKVDRVENEKYPVDDVDLHDAVDIDHKHKDCVDS
jgi:hypothetical protein